MSNLLQFKTPPVLHHAGVLDPGLLESRIEGKYELDCAEPPGDTEISDKPMQVRAQMGLGHHGYCFLSLSPFPSYTLFSSAHLQHSLLIRLIVCAVSAPFYLYYRLTP